MTRTFKDQEQAEPRAVNPEGTLVLPRIVRLSGLEPLFVCQACGKRGADVRPDFGRARMGMG
jgi:hypothetical protein